MGVSSAICLQDADPSLDLTIIAEKFSPDNTSDGAAGMWSSIPGFWMKDTDKHKQRYRQRVRLLFLKFRSIQCLWWLCILVSIFSTRQWGEATFHYLKAIIESDISCDYHMSYITGYIVYDKMMPEVLHIHTLLLSSIWWPNNQSWSSFLTRWLYSNEMLVTYFFQEPPLKDVCLYYRRLPKNELEKLGFASDIM